MKIHDVVQGTRSWTELRAGIPTASEFDKVITPGKKLSEARHKYARRLIAERLTGEPIEPFVSEWMERGSALEARAVKAYEFEHDIETVRIGFVTNDAGTAGASPDRFIKDHPEGALETKCPMAETHVGYLLAASGDEGAAKEYKVQLQGQLWICEREWVDICSYHPDLPPALWRVFRDEPFIKEMATLVTDFTAFVGEQFERIAKLIPARIAPVEEPGPFGLSDEDVAWALSRTPESIAREIRA